MDRLDSSQSHTTSTRLASTSCSSFKFIGLLRQQAFFKGYPGLEHLKEKREVFTFLNTSVLSCHIFLLITDLEWFANSNDALESTTVVTQHTLSPPHGDFLFTHKHLQIQMCVNPLQNQLMSSNCTPPHRTTTCITSSLKAASSSLTHV